MLMCQRYSTWTAQKPQQQSILVFLLLPLNTLGTVIAQVLYCNNTLDQDRQVFRKKNCVQGGFPNAIYCIFKVVIIYKHFYFSKKNRLKILIIKIWLHSLFKKTLVFYQTYLIIFIITWKKQLTIVVATVML